MFFCYQTFLEGEVSVSVIVGRLKHHRLCFRYKRIFSIGTMGITTYNPSTLEVTNKWVYSDFISLTPLKTAGNVASLEFQITMRKDRRTDNMKFSSEHRAHLLTDALKFRNLFAERPKEILVRIAKMVNIW